MPDGNGIKTDIDMKGAFTAACSIAGNVKLVKVPLPVYLPDLPVTSELNLSDSVDPGDGASHKEKLNNESTGTNGPGQGVDILRIIDNEGGYLDEAQLIIDTMQERYEITIIDGYAKSAATLVGISGNIVLIREGSEILTHETRDYFGNPPDTPERAQLASIVDEFFPGVPAIYVQDYEWIRDMLLEDGRAEDAALVEKRMKEIEGYNEYVAGVIKDAHPNITPDCAKSIAGDYNDNTFNAEDSVRLGLADAVIMDDGTMLVREDDPRAIAIREQNPGLYAELNPEEAKPQPGMIRHITLASNTAAPAG